MKSLLLIIVVFTYEADNYGQVVREAAIQAKQ